MVESHNLSHAPRCGLERRFDAQLCLGAKRESFFQLVVLLGEQPIAASRAGDVRRFTIETPVRVFPKDVAFKKNLWPMVDPEAKSLGYTCGFDFDDRPYVGRVVRSKPKHP